MLTAGVSFVSGRRLSPFIDDLSTTVTHLCDLAREVLWTVMSGDGQTGGHSLTMVNCQQFLLLEDKVSSGQLRCVNGPLTECWVGFIVTPA